MDKTNLQVWQPIATGFIQNARALSAAPFDIKEDDMMNTIHAVVAVVMIVAICVTGCVGPRNSIPHSESPWQEEFDISKCTLVPTGRNQYFILEPGFQLVLEGKNERLAITVLDETKEVNGVTTRVVEEREWKNGNLTEVSRNFFAICESTEDVFYFGEEVDMYRGGEVVSHSGAWLAGNRKKRGAADVRPVNAFTEAKQAVKTTEQEGGQT